MKIIANPGSLILFSLIAQGGFSAIILLLKRENKAANRYLAVLIVLMSLWICDAFFRVGGIYDQNPNFYFLPIFWSLAFGPLLFFYTCSLTSPGFRLTRSAFWHFIPALLQGGFYGFLQSRDYAFRREFWLNYHQPFSYDLELALSFGSLILYLFLALWQLRTYKRDLEDHFSNLHRITLNWLGSLLTVLSFLAFFWLAELITRYFLDYYPIAPLSSITIALAVLLMGVGGILQKDLQATMGALIDQPVDSLETRLSSVSDQLLADINRGMEQKELFLNQELSLKDFAQALGIPQRELSVALNQGMGTSFINYVNQFRVQRVKQLIQDPALDHLSLLGIALESGFNSKSTFNRVFKKMEGISPSEFRERLKT